jgi:hypothetical protein
MGRWECLIGARLGADLYQVANVPFLADGIGVLDLVRARVEEDSGRLVVREVAIRSQYRTVRVTCSGTDRGRRRLVDGALDVVASNEAVIWERVHVAHPRFWTFAVGRQDVTWLHSVLGPLAREGLVSYEVPGED